MKNFWKIFTGAVAISAASSVITGAVIKNGTKIKETFFKKNSEQKSDQK